MQRMSAQLLRIGIPMLALFRSHPIQRALAALLVMALLSVAAAAHACKTVQILSLAGIVSVSQQQGHGHVNGVAAGVPDTDTLTHQPADLLRHDGACHLLAAVGLPSGSTQLREAVPSASWLAVLTTGFSSCNWPPPRHPPRAA